MRICAARTSSSTTSSNRATTGRIVLRSAPVDDFSLAYERSGSGSGALLLHGWPGDHSDYRALVPLLGDEMDVVVPDLRGFGDSDKHVVDPVEGYSAAAQARSLAALIDELGLEQPVIVGYDIGSRIAQTLARSAPSNAKALVLAPPLPGAGERVLTPAAQREFWYQAFHQLPLAERLVDGNPDAVRAYLQHFWTHWSGPAFQLADDDLDRLVGRYAQRGAFTASIAWYRAGSGTVATSLTETTPAPADRIAHPTVVLWPAHDPLFPPHWADRLEAFFSSVTITRLPESGHFSPLEAPEAFATAIRETVSSG
jgi:pimeloyl-ACP methyl ester carboxylesterase